MMISVAINAIASTITEITLLQHLALYPRSCTNSFTTGTGSGALIGASWALTIQIFAVPYLSIICCLVFPVGLIITFFCILPNPDHGIPTLDLLDAKTEESAHDSAVQIEYGQNVDIERNLNDEHTENIGAFKSLKRMLVDYYKYSIPALSIEIMWEIVRGGFIVAIWPAKGNIDFYGKFIWIFQFASALGKFSSNFFATTRYRKWLIVMLCVGIVFGAIHWDLMSSDWIPFLRETFWGHVLVLGGMTVPFGFGYGAVTSNGYYAIRTEIQNENERAFVMGGVASTFIYGQILGTLAALLFHGISSENEVSELLSFIVH